MRTRLLSFFLAMTVVLSCLALPVSAGKGDDGPFDYTEAGVYRRVETEWGDYNERLTAASVTLPVSETGIGFSYLAVLDGEEYGNGPEMTPLPAGWKAEYLFMYTISDPVEDGTPLTLAEAIPIGMEAAGWAAAVNRYVDETYGAWSEEHPDESKSDYAIVCDYTPFLNAQTLNWSENRELPLLSDSQLFTDGESCYTDRYYTCVVRFLRDGEPVHCTSVYQMELFVDFSGPGSRDYMPTVLSEPAPLGDHEKSGSGALTEPLNATAVYGNKDMTYCWFRSDTGAEGTFTTIYGVDEALYYAPYPAEEYASVYYYATYRYTDDNNIPREGRTTVAKLTRTAYTNFTLKFVPDFVASGAPAKPDDFVLPQSLKNCTVTLSSAAFEYTDSFTVQDFTFEKQYNIALSSDYVITVKNTEGNTICTERFVFSTPGAVHTVGLDRISLLDLKVFLDGTIASQCPSLDPAGLHVSAWHCDYRYTPEGEPFASGVVGSDGYVNWTGYGRELPAESYVLCQITDELLETQDAKMYLNTDSYYHVQPYQINVQPNAYAVTHGGTDQAVSAVTHAAGNYSVLVKSTAGTPLEGITVNFTACGDNYSTVYADAVTDENGRCTVKMETLPQQRTAAARIEEQTTSNGYTWNNYSVNLEPGVEKTISMYGYSSDPLFELNVKVKSADGLTLTDYAGSDYAGIPLQLTLNGIPVVLGSDGKIHTEEIRLNMNDQMTVRGNVLRSELDVLTGSVTGKFDINTSLELILEPVPVGTYSVCVRDHQYRPANGVVIHFTCEGQTKAVMTDEEGHCEAQFLGDPAGHTVSAYFAQQKNADGSVWDGHRTETLTAGEEFPMTSNVHFEAPLLGLKVRVMNGGGETTPYEESAYRDIPLSVVVNGKTAVQSGSYYAPSGLRLNYDDTLTFEVSAALSPTEIVGGSVTVTFEGAKMTTEMILYPLPVVTLECLDYTGNPHEGTPRRVLVMTNTSYPQRCLYDFITTESTVRFCVPLERSTSFLTAFTWNTAETEWQYAYAHAAEDGTHQSFPVPDRDTAHALKGGFDPLGGGGSSFFIENGFRAQPVIAMKSEGIWSVAAHATVYHCTSRTTKNLKDVFVLPEGSEEITVTQSAAPAVITVNEENHTVTVEYEETPRTYTFINIYFDIPEEKLDADRSCTLESYAEYDYLGEHYSAALNRSIARADGMTVSGRAEVSLNSLERDGYALTLRLPARGKWDVTVFDNDAEVKTLTGVSSKQTVSVPLAAVTGEHTLRCEMTDGSVTGTRTLTVSVLPDTRPVLQKLTVNGVDMTDGSAMLTYNASSSRFDVQAEYTHPEQIEKLWLTAETTAENYYLELKWNESAGVFKSYGELGSVHEPVYSVWLYKVEKWDPDTVMDLVTYDDSLFTDVLYFNETNLVPASEDPLQEQALADWETYTDFINHYHDSTDKESALAALRDLFGADNVWYTPAIYLPDSTVWRQAFRYDPDSVAAALSSPNTVTVNINGTDVKSAMTFDPDEGITYFAGCADSMLPPVLKTESPKPRLMAYNPLNLPDPTKIVDFASFLTVGNGIKTGYDWGSSAWDIGSHWGDPVNDDTADDWIDRITGIPGSPSGAGAVGKTLHDQLRRRQDDARRAAKGLPPRGGSGGGGGGGDSGGVGGGGGGGPTAPLIDPSGYIYEAVESNRVEGVSASLYYKDGENWIAWDSEAYGQSANPMRSLEDGIYGWDVLPGTWKVVFEKDGYLTAESEELPVPPPHLDVNISLVSDAAPAIQSVAVNDDGSVFTLTFDRYMKVTDLTAPGAVTAACGGAILSGTLAAVNAEAVKTGSKQAVGAAGLTADEQAASVFTFTLSETPAPGTTVTVTVDASVRAYNGKTLSGNDSTSVTVPGTSPSDGGNEPVRYSLSVFDALHGSVSADVMAAVPGQTVTLTVRADKGFTPETLTVSDCYGNLIALADVKTGETYTFRMPDCPVSVTVSFMEDNSMLNFFADVKPTDYFYDAVLWAAENGIAYGVDETHFAPLGTASRAETVTFLWRAAGCPEPASASCRFTDVKEDAYYYKAVLWAAEQGITYGTGETVFSPDGTVSRGEAVTFLARMNGVKDDAVGYTHGFEDVRADAYYNNAVAWAYANKITVGTGAAAFSPDDDCLRSQIVCFLYRCSANS